MARRCSCSLSPASSWFSLNCAPLGQGHWGHPKNDVQQNFRDFGSPAGLRFSLSTQPPYYITLPLDIIYGWSPGGMEGKRRGGRGRTRLTTRRRRRLSEQDRLDAFVLPTPFSPLSCVSTFFPTRESRLSSPARSLHLLESRNLDE